MENLKHIVNQFRTNGQVAEVTVFGEGMINNTYRVSLINNSTEYVLQKVKHILL